MLVTTSYNPKEEMRAYAERLASELQWPWIERGRQSLAQLKITHHAQRLLIVTHKGLHYIGDEQPVFFFHPSLATIRLKRLSKGETDTLISCSGALPGDSILDCTAGMATDAIVLSHHVGRNGQVIALESEQLPYLLVREGLQHYNSAIEPLNEAMRRIRVKQIEHLTFLEKQPERSVDIIYLDPMFRRPLEQSSALAPLRTLANTQPLRKEAIEEARRVARKTVVLKEHRDSGEFARLGFTQVIRTQSKIAYGVITL